MLKKLTLLVIAMLAVVLVGLRWLAGKDSWICQEGIWVKHGKPSSSMSTQPCPGGQVKEVTMKLTSSAFSENQPIPAKYTCDGENISPPLDLAEIPAGTKSMVLIVEDPDAPSGTWVHWLVWNIAAQTKEIAEGKLPAGAIEGTTSFGRPGYGGPCPPSGEHRYVFKLYALDTSLTLSTSANKSTLESAMASHILGQAQLTGLYSRK